MKILLSFLLFYLIYTQNNTQNDTQNSTFSKKYAYSYVSTELLEMFTSNIVGMKGKTNITKCFAQKDIKSNETIFEYEKNIIISNTNMDLPNKDKIESIINKYVNDIYLKNKILLSFFIYHVMTSPGNNSELEQKFRLFLLYLPVEDINPIKLYLDEYNLEEYLINKEWLDYQKDEEIELINNIINNTLDIDINNTDEYYILFMKIYYHVKTSSFNINGNAIILPFLDTCNIIPYYLNREVKINQIFLEEKENKIIVKSKLDLNPSDQFVFSFDIPLTNDYLLINKGKVIFNNINDRYIIKKNFTFEDKTKLDSFMAKMNLKEEDLLKLKIQKKSDTNIRFALFNFELAPNKIENFVDKFSDIYYNNRMKKYIFIIRICYDEFKNILQKIEDKFESKSFKDYLLKIQEEKEISESKNAIMNFNLAKIGILEKNVNFAFEKLVQLNINEMRSLKKNYL